MKKMFVLFVTLIALLVLAASANAGPGSNNYIPDSLNAYLNLDRQQNADANRILTDFYEFTRRQFDRYFQLDQQIWSIRNDSTVDPITIGIRIGNLLGEQIAIEREVDKYASQTRKNLVGLLNSFQTHLLSRLVDALNLESTGWAAVGANFLAPPAQSQTPAPTVGRGAVGGATTTFSILLEAQKQRIALHQQSNRDCLFFLMTSCSVLRSAHLQGVLI